MTPPPLARLASGEPRVRPASRLSATNRSSLTSTYRRPAGEGSPRFRFTRTIFIMFDARQSVIDARWRWRTGVLFRSSELETLVPSFEL